MLGRRRALRLRTPSECQMGLHHRCGDGASDVNRWAGVARRRANRRASASPMRIRKSVSQRAYPVHNGHRFTQDGLDGLFGMLVWGKVERLCGRRVKLGEVFPVGVDGAPLIQHTLAYRLKQCAYDCDGTLRVSQPPRYGFRPNGVHAFRVECSEGVSRQQRARA